MKGGKYTWPLPRAGLKLCFNWFHNPMAKMRQLVLFKVYSYSVIKSCIVCEKSLKHAVPRYAESGIHYFATQMDANASFLTDILDFKNRKF